MKKSTLALVLLLPLLGLLPLGAGVLSPAAAPGSTAVEATATPAGSTAEGSTQQGTVDEYLQVPTEGDVQQIESTATKVVGIVNSIFGSNSNVTATVGAVNTALAGWLAFFLRRREKIEEKVNLIRQDMGDLIKMPLGEFWQLLWKATRSWLEFQRLLLRTNKQYSIYGFSHVALLPKLSGRPIQWLDRSNTSANWIIESLGLPNLADWLSKERSLTSLNRAWLNDRAKAVGFMQDDSSTAHSDFLKWLRGDSWRSDPSRSADPKKLTDGMEANEIAIAFFFQMGDDRKETFTLIGSGVDVPETLEQWEELIIAFKQENKMVMKDAILVSVLAIHLPVN